MEGLEAGLKELLKGLKRRGREEWWDGEVSCEGKSRCGAERRGKVMGENGG